MSLVRIESKGWEHFNGYLGTAEFKNGVSVRELTPLELRRIGGNIQIVEVDSERQVGDSVTMANARHISAELAPSLTKESDEPKVEDKVEGKYTYDKLVEIADRGGIKALREIAHQFGVKGVQISNMIDGILEAQKEVY